MNQRRLHTLVAIVLAASLGACATTQTDEAPAKTEAAPAPAAKANGNTSYEVQRGDHLWGIASQPRIYGNPYAWPLIYKTNSGKIKDADLIYPGQNLEINRSASSSDMDAAVRHAKTRGEWKLGVAEDSDKAYLKR